MREPDEGKRPLGEGDVWPKSPRPPRKWDTKRKPSGPSLGV